MEYFRCALMTINNLGRCFIISDVEMLILFILDLN